MESGIASGNWAACFWFPGFLFLSQEAVNGVFLFIKKMCVHLWNFLPVFVHLALLFYPSSIKFEEVSFLPLMKGPFCCFFFVLTL